MALENKPGPDENILDRKAIISACRDAVAVPQSLSVSNPTSTRQNDNLELIGPICRELALHTAPSIGEAVVRGKKIVSGADPGPADDRESAAIANLRAATMACIDLGPEDCAAYARVLEAKEAQDREDLNKAFKPK